MIIFESFKDTILNEDLIGRVGYENEIIKNPRSIKRMSDDIRGFIDSDGNLYVSTDNEYLHGSLLEYLRSSGSIERTDTDSSDYWKNPIGVNCVAVQRLENSIDFYISDLLGENIKSNKNALAFIKKLIAKASTVNSHYNFHTETIPED